MREWGLGTSFKAITLTEAVKVGTRVSLVSEGESGGAKSGKQLKRVRVPLDTLKMVEERVWSSESLVQWG